MVLLKTTKKELSKTLNHLKAVVKGRSIKAKQTVCEITITDKKATFAVPGSIFNLQCQTEGVAKITVPFRYFLDIIRHHKSDLIEMEINNGEVTIGQLTFAARTCFIEDDKILRTIQLPANYDDNDLMRLRYQGYTTEELDFNKMTPLIDEATERLEKRLNKSHEILKVYNLNYTELESLVMRKIKSPH